MLIPLIFGPSQMFESLVNAPVSFSTPIEPTEPARLVSSVTSRKDAAVMVCVPDCEPDVLIAKPFGVADSVKVFAVGTVRT